MIVGLAAIGLAHAVSAAPAYPDRPVRFIVSSGAGGAPDFNARVLATELGVKSPPDGHTLTVIVSNFASYPSLYKLVFDAVKDVQPIIQLTQGPFLVAIHPSLPAKNTRELIALAKKNPGELNYASTGSGALSHLGVEHFSMMAGIKLTHIPYKGTGLGLVDTIAGLTQVIFGSILPTLPHVRSGKLRGIAVTTAQRVTAEPNIPTVAESGLPGYEVNNWNGLIAPRGTPRPVIDRLNAEFGKILRNKEVAQRLQNDGSAPAGGSPEEFEARLAKEMALWSKVIAKGGIRVE